MSACYAVTPLSMGRHTSFHAVATLALSRHTCCRYGGIAWCDDNLALLYESLYDSRRSRVWTLAPGNPCRPPKLLFDRNYEDIYTDPGHPLAVRHPVWPSSVLARVDGGDALLMQGAPPA
jgi:hypothetical protein